MKSRSAPRSLLLNDLARRVHPARRERHRAAFDERSTAHPNPRALAKRLIATKEEAWRFRVGDYRIITQFHDSRLVVLVVEVGNRREVYR
ncbi:type II toxin-antitoxin system RelE family toxin [Mesorhizobium sp. AR02]|uniref:type II toxin-antitoxin system RelE family toxin n=1 Tax=Mesorhizobium sp. AR02 TaxID=2865837 RepID=UPI0029622D1A|nr:type II toxin-antitoxin system RelE/ParE family toxin [Mesorhizobium sp. AR02]